MLRGAPMLFVDFLGPIDLFRATAPAIREQVASAFHATPASIVVRRFEVESTASDVELWIEVSSEEQIYRYGPRLAAQVTAVVREVSEHDVWVMFRVVPLSHAFLNGEPRARSVESFE
jgi:hypothetical protein